MATSGKTRSAMNHVSSSSLLDIPSCLSYTTSFLSFTSEDGAAINASKSLLVPLVPTILDLVYIKLLTYDITAAAFVPRQGTRYETDPAPSKAQDLDLNHPHILRQKDFLKGYLMRILSNQG